jgi:hypothetical protein
MTSHITTAIANTTATPNIIQGQTEVFFFPTDGIVVGVIIGVVDIGSSVCIVSGEDTGGGVKSDELLESEKVSGDFVSAGGCIVSVVSFVFMFMFCLGCSNVVLASGVEVVS